MVSIFDFIAPSDAMFFSMNLARIVGLLLALGFLIAAFFVSPRVRTTLFDALVPVGGLTVLSMLYFVYRDADVSLTWAFYGLLLLIAFFSYEYVAYRVRKRKDPDPKEVTRAQLIGGSVLTFAVLPLVLGVGFQISAYESVRSFNQAIGFGAEHYFSDGRFDALTADDIAHLERKVVWYGPEVEELVRVRTLQKVMTLGIPSTLLRLAHPETLIASDTSDWQVAKIIADFGLKGRDGKPANLKIYCFYQGGDLVHSSTILPNLINKPLDQAEDPRYRALQGFCSQSFNPDNAPLASPLVTSLG